MLVSAFCQKEVVDANSGEKLGYVDDVIFCERTAQIEKIVIYGKGRMLGLFKKMKDIEVAWSDIRVIGEDTVLIDRKNC